jgi:hypothetical protein
MVNYEIKIQNIKNITSYKIEIKGEVRLDVHINLDIDPYFIEVSFIIENNTLNFSYCVEPLGDNHHISLDDEFLNYLIKKYRLEALF